jgi:hypothetical protein
VKRSGGRWKAGTNIRRELDVAAMREALAGPGADPRVWVARGTVATVGDDGTVDYETDGATVIAPRGIDVDVVIEPIDHPVTCRYGLSYGGGVILTPIHTGDLVLVLMPFGDLATVPEIVKVLGGPHTPLPVNDADSLPFFRNDRVFIYGSEVPIDLLVSGGARLLINPDGTIQIGDGADEQLVLGTTYRSNQQTLDQALLTAIVPAAAACHAATTPATALTALQALATMLDAFTEAYNSFEGNASAYLSAKNKTK